MKLLLSYLIITVLSCLILTGCGILESGAYAPALLKVKCSDQVKSQIKTVHEIQQKVPAEVTHLEKTPDYDSQPANKALNLSILKKASSAIVKSSPISLPLKIISKKIPIPPDFNSIFHLKNTATAPKIFNTESKEKKKGGLIGLFAVICLILGFLFIISSMPGNFIFGAYNVNLLMIGFIFLLASIVLAVFGIFSDNSLDFTLSLITLIVWMMLFIYASSR